MSIGCMGCWVQWFDCETEPTACAEVSVVLNERRVVSLGKTCVWFVVVWRNGIEESVIQGGVY